MEDSVGMIANTDAYKSMHYSPSVVHSGMNSGQAEQKNEVEDAANEMARINSKSSTQ